jgi:predicted amidohydrolase
MAVAWLFPEKFDVFGIDSHRLTLAEEEDVWGTKFSGIIERILRAIREAHAEPPKWLAFCELFYLGQLHRNDFTLSAQERHLKSRHLDNKREATVAAGAAAVLKPDLIR